MTQILRQLLLSIDQEADVTAGHRGWKNEKFAHLFRQVEKQIEWEEI
jgi:hypothetical protein